jgi:hypothetical protein
LAESSKATDLLVVIEPPLTVLALLEPSCLQLTLRKLDFLVCVGTSPLARAVAAAAFEASKLALVVVISSPARADIAACLAASTSTLL